MWSLVITFGCLSVLFLAGFFLTRYYRRRRVERMQGPVSSEIYNTTNYSIANLNMDQLANLSPGEAKVILKEWRESGYIPSHREFYQIRRIIRREEDRCAPDGEQ